MFIGGACVSVGVGVMRIPHEHLTPLREEVRER